MCSVLRTVDALWWRHCERTVVAPQLSSPLILLLVDPLPDCSHRLARCGAMATEVLQATIGVINHRHMAPSHAGAQPAAALIYLPYGTTFLWMLCYSAFSTLPFDLLLMQQALVVSGAGAAARGEVVGRWPARWAGRQQLRRQQLGANHVCMPSHITIGARHACVWHQPAATLNPCTQHPSPTNP